jgi:hypothetical protein
MIDFTLVKKLLESEEWILIKDNSGSDDTMNDSQGILDKPQLVFENKYAVAGMVFAENVDEVEKVWISCQNYMSMLCADGIISSSAKDIYLIFFISCLDPDATSRLRQIIDNTYVCRKICVENGCSGIKELFRSVPLIKLISSEEKQINTSFEHNPIIDDVDLSDRIMDDLYKRSAEAIIKKLMNGEYDEVKLNENKKSDT